MIMPRFRLADDGLTILEIEEYWNVEDGRFDERGFAVAMFIADTTPEFRAEFIASANGGRRKDEP